MSTTNIIISVTFSGAEFIFDELILDNIFNYLNIIEFLSLCFVNSEINNYIKKSQRLKILEENKIKLQKKFKNKILGLWEKLFLKSKLENLNKNLDIGLYFTKNYCKSLDWQHYRLFPKEWKLNYEITLNYFKYSNVSWNITYFLGEYLPKTHFNNYDIIKYINNFNYRILQYASNELKENSDLFELACCKVLECDREKVIKIREDYNLLKKILLKDALNIRMFPKSLFKNIKLVIFGMKYYERVYNLYKEYNLPLDLLFKEITRKDIFWFKSELFKDEEFVLNILQYSKLDNHWRLILITHYYNNISKFPNETLLQIVKLVPHSIKLFYTKFTKEELQKLSFQNIYILKQLKKLIR